MLDKETEELIRTPRCGVEDVLEEELVDNQEILEVGGEENDTYFPVERRRKRYALQGSRWRTKSLTYKIGKYASAISRSEVTASCRLLTSPSLAAGQPGPQGLLDVAGSLGPHLQTEQRQCQHRDQVQRRESESN